MGRHFETELDRLKKKILLLSSVVEESVEKAVRSVRNRDEVLAREVIDKDHLIDLNEVEVEEECLKILALHQPVAVDLRFLVAVLKINNDLERIADIAVNIAERSLFLSRHEPIDIPFDFEEMNKKSRSMLKQSLESLIHQDSKLASEVCHADDLVDQLNREMYTRVYAAIRKRPEWVEAYVNCLSISRHLERIADYATNIAEDVIYMVEGRIVRHKPDDEFDEN